MHRERTMGKPKLAFVAFDSAKEKHAVVTTGAMAKCAQQLLTLFLEIKPRHLASAG
jgi:hypothetical protein